MVIDEATLDRIDRHIEFNDLMSRLLQAQSCGFDTVCFSNPDLTEIARDVGDSLMIAIDRVVQIERASTEIEVEEE